MWRGEAGGSHGGTEGEGAGRGGRGEEGRGEGGGGGGGGEAGILRVVSISTTSWGGMGTKQTSNITAQVQVMGMYMYIVHVLRHINNAHQMYIKCPCKYTGSAYMYMCVIHVDGTANIGMQAAYTHTHTRGGLTGGGEPARASHRRHRETCREDDDGHCISHLTTHMPTSSIYSTYTMYESELHISLYSTVESQGTKSNLQNVPKYMYILHHGTSVQKPGMPFELMKDSTKGIIDRVYCIIMYM